MPDQLTSKREQIEMEFLDAMEAARARYRADKSKQGEYVCALKTFNDFVITGKLPEGMETTASSPD